MAEKRDIKRKRKRIKLRFGVEFPKRVAFTEDVSNYGLFIITGQPEKPGSLLLIEMHLTDDVKVSVRGVVRWAKKVPPQLVRVANKGGMGVRLLDFEYGEEEYKTMVAELRH